MRDLGPDRGLIVQFLLDHVGLKLMALAIAVGLFVLVRCETETVRTLHLDVVVELPPLGSRQVLVSQLPTKVRVDLRGPRAQLDELDIAELTPLRVDLRRDGRTELALAELVRVSDPVQVIRVDPNRVALEWRPRAERRVPVALAFDGAPPHGLQLGPSIQLDPPTVTVTGPHAEVATLQRVDTEKLALGQFGVGSYQLPIRLKTLPHPLAYVDVDSVRVRLDVRPAVPVSAPALPHRETDEPSASPQPRSP